MKRFITIIFMLAFLAMMHSRAQGLPVKLEELNAVEFRDAVAKSSKTAILPIGVMEKHGPHLPLGTDVLTAREISLRAAKEEYAVVFPWYYFSQINEAKQQPGTIAYSPELIWKILQETLDELSRNGFKKIIIFNSHGGNNAFLEYFCMAQLSERRDYAVYWHKPTYDMEAVRQAEAITMHDPLDNHAGNRETSMVKAIVPDLVNTGLAKTQRGNDLDRISNLSNVYTGIWWYASYPDHYSGDGSKATAKAGEILIQSAVDNLVKVIRDVKADKNVLKLQEQYFNDSDNPLNTKQPHYE